MPKKMHFSEFTSEQLEQIDRVYEASQTLIEVLLIKPDYLKQYPLKDIKQDELRELPYGKEVADLVAEYLMNRLAGKANVYFPTHCDHRLFADNRIVDGSEYVTDTFNEDEIQEE